MANSSIYNSKTNNMKTRRNGLIRKNRRCNFKKPLLMPYFLLGGNERDPLNLNALIQQKKQKTSQTESINLPKSSNNNSSSEDVTIEIMLPPNTRDPLKLDDQRPNLSLSATSKRKDVTPFRKRRYRQISQSYSNRNHFVTSPFIPPHISHMASIAPFAKYISPPIRPLLSVQTSLPNSVNNHSNLCSPSFRFGTQYYNQNRANPTGFPVSLPYNNNNNRQKYGNSFRTAF